MGRDTWICYNYLGGVSNASVWMDLLNLLESSLEEVLSKLDVNDPQRRNAGDSKSNAEFISSADCDEDIRWIFGSFKKSKVRISICIYKVNDYYPNSVLISIPEKCITNIGWDAIKRIFKGGNVILDPFYSYCDYADVICCRVPSTPVLDISVELLGVFWLTYFGSSYRSFFRKNLTSVDYCELVPDGGVTIILDESPGELADKRSYSVENQLGSNSFANGIRSKVRGEFVLPIEKI